MLLSFGFGQGNLPGPIDRRYRSGLLKNLDNTRKSYAPEHTKVRWV